MAEDWIQAALLEPGTNPGDTRVSGFWIWLRDTLNSEPFQGIDPVDTLDALVDIFQLDGYQSERSGSPDRLHYVPIAPDGTVLALRDDTGQAQFARLPQTVQTGISFSMGKVAGSDAKMRQEASVFVNRMVALMAQADHSLPFTQRARPRNDDPVETPSGPIPSMMAVPRINLLNHKVALPPAFERIKTLEILQEFLGDQIARMNAWAQDDPEAAAASLQFYHMMGAAALDLANGDINTADLYLRWFAFLSPRASVPSNAAKAVGSGAAAFAAGVTPGFKAGTMSQVKGMSVISSEWEAGDAFAMHLPGVDNKVRNFYLNGAAELLKITMANNNSPDAEVLALAKRLATSLEVSIKTRGGVGVNVTSLQDIPALMTELDRLVTSDMWDQAALGNVVAGFIMDPAKPDKSSHIWVDPRGGKVYPLDSAEAQAVLAWHKENGENKNQEIDGKKVGVRGWSDLTPYELESLQYDPAAKTIKIFSPEEDGESLLAAGGESATYDISQAMSGLMADVINALGGMAGKARWTAYNVQEFRWGMVKIRNPRPALRDFSSYDQAINALRAFSQAFESGAVKNSMMEALRESIQENQIKLDKVREEMAAKKKPTKAQLTTEETLITRIQQANNQLKNLKTAPVNASLIPKEIKKLIDKHAPQTAKGSGAGTAIEAAYASQARQLMPFEVQSEAGGKLYMAIVEAALAKLKAAGDTNPMRTLLERMLGGGLIGNLQQALDQSSFPVTLRNIWAGVGSYLGTLSNNLTIEMSGPRWATTTFNEAIAQALEQTGGNIIRRPTLNETLAGAKTTPVVKIPLPDGFTEAQIADLMNRLGKIKDSRGKSSGDFLGGHTTLVEADGTPVVAMHGGFYEGSDFLIEIGKNKAQIWKAIDAVFPKNKQFFTEDLIVEAYNNDPKNAYAQPRRKNQSDSRGAEATDSRAERGVDEEGRTDGDAADGARRDLVARIRANVIASVRRAAAAGQNAKRQRINSADVVGRLIDQIGQAWSVETRRRAGEKDAPLDPSIIASTGGENVIKTAVLPTLSAQVIAEGLENSNLRGIATLMWDIAQRVARPGVARVEIRKKIPKAELAALNKAVIQRHTGKVSETKNGLGLVVYGNKAKAPKGYAAVPLGDGGTILYHVARVKEKWKTGDPGENILRAMKSNNPPIKVSVDIGANTSEGYGYAVTYASQGAAQPVVSSVENLTEQTGRRKAEAIEAEEESQRFDSTKDSISFALSHSGILRIEEAVARRMTRGPDERLEFFERLRNRLAATVLQLREAKRNAGGFEAMSEPERERNRIRDAMAEVNAVIQALPAEARGRVPLTLTDVLDQDTERGQVSAIIRLIDQADEALETVLLKDYREAFEKLLDLAKPDLRQNKSLRGRLTPDTQRLVGHILEAVTLDSDQLAAALAAKQAEIDAQESLAPDTPEAVREAQRRLVELYQEQSILETFGAFSKMDAASTAAAYEALLGIYTTGRSARKILDENRRAEIEAMRMELLSTLPQSSQPRHAEKMAEKGIAVGAEAWRLGMSSFHQFMEWIFPESMTARDMQDRVRQADRAFTRMKLEAKDRFDRFIFSTWNLSGPSRRRQANRILADLSTLRDWNITLAEGVAFATEKLTEEQAAAILAGKMKTGWETDRIAMTSLENALADFRMQRLKAQQEDRQFRSRVIRFQRLIRRGSQVDFKASDLQALYYLQLYAQEQYRPALDKYGFTAEVMEAMEKQLNPRARDLGEFLRAEYDAEWQRLNPVYRAIYGLNMPRIRNYAPGAFEHLDAKGPGDDSTIDPSGAPAGVNAMAAGFTKTRTHHMARPREVNAMAKFWSHMEATNYFIAYAEVARDLRQIFRHPEVRRRVETAYGPQAARLLGQWLDAIEVDGNFRAVEMEALAAMTHNTLATQSAVGLAYNLGVLFKQLSASFGVLWEMPTIDALRGLTSLLRNPGRYAAVWQSEAIQQRVLRGINPEDRRLLDAAQASPSLILELLELGRLPIAYADAVFTGLSAAVAYSHHYDRAIQDGLTDAPAHAHALAVAERVIVRTAQPATTQDKSMAELTAKGFGKFLFMFRSDPRQKLAIAMQTVQELRAGRISPVLAAKRLLWTWAIYGLAAEVMSDVWQAISRDDDDPDRWDWRDYLAAMLAGPVSGAPLIGGAIEYAFRSTIGTKAFADNPNPIAQSARIPSATRKLMDQIEADDLDVQATLTAAQQLSSALALATGWKDQRVAIAPAVLRALRDGYGMASNLAALALGPDDEDKALEIVRKYAQDAKQSRDGRSQEIDTLAKQLAKLPPDARAQRLARLDADTRRTLARKLRAADMTASEMALSRLPAAERAKAIEEIAAGMSELDLPAWLERLRALGLR